MEQFWHSKDIKKIFEELNTNKSGLSRNEVENRLKENGFNILPKEKKETLIQIFFSQFKNPIIFLLIIAIILSFIIGESIDALFISIVILIDIVFGTFQEWRAGKTSEALESLIKVKVKVIRDGKTSVVDSEKLVIGDIVILDPGNKISADLRIIECNNFTIDESVLTGESVASIKCIDIINENVPITDRDNMAYAGTTVLSGRAKAIVVSTSTNTEIGKIANTVLLSKDTKSPLIIRMEKFTKQIGIIVIVISLILTFILYIRGYAPKEIFFLVVALSISAIPEGLPVVLTLALSIASSRMSKKNVIVKKLNSVESLGSCTIIASDKTGTLTLNEQTAKKIIIPNGEEINIEGIGYNGNGIVNYNNKNKKHIFELSLMGVINNEAALNFNGKDWTNYGDSIDVAFLAMGYKAKVIENSNILEVFESIPYESVNKYSAVFYRNGKNYCTAKGSIEKILDISNKMLVDGKEISIDKEKIIKQNEKLASEGFRVIAICKKELDNKKEYFVKDLSNSVFLGLVAFIDPIREEVISSIKEAKRAEIKVVVITGDHPLTSFTIAKELELVTSIDEVTNGEEIEKVLKQGKSNFDKFIKNIKVFSRVNPMQKLEIIESYKRQGEFVAVTGDGVNDAPAIKAANIGVAMGSGTDVAKDTSTMVITDDNFTSIVSGIEQGRIAYNNIRKVIYFLISNGVAEILFILLAIVFKLPIPLVALQLLWLNLVTDGIQDVGLAFEKGFDDVMNDKPRNTKEKIFNKLLIEETLISGIFIGLIVYGAWHYLMVYAKIDVHLARSYILILMVFMQNIHAFNCRNEHSSAFKIPFKNNPFFILAIISVLIIQIFVIHNPITSEILKVSILPYKDILLMFLFALPVLLVMEIYKFIKRKKQY